MNKNRILIMDHDKRISRVISRISKRMGFESLSVHSPDMFKTSYAEFKPDIVLVDLELSEEASDFKFLYYLAEQNSKVTIILLSGMDEVEIMNIKKLGLSLGLEMDGVIRKPIDIDDVKSKLGGLELDDPARPLKKNILETETCYAKLQIM